MWLNLTHQLLSGAQAHRENVQWSSPVIPYCPRVPLPRGVPLFWCDVWEANSVYVRLHNSEKSSSMHETGGHYNLLVKEGNMRRGFYTPHDSGHIGRFEVTSACVLCVLRPLVVEAVRGRGSPVPKSDLPRDVEPSGCRRADGEVHRVVTRWAVREERGDVGDGSHQQRADLGVLVVGQRDDHVVLVPHMEGVVRKRVRWRRMAEGRALLGFVLVQFFVINRTQHTI